MPATLSTFLLGLGTGAAISAAFWWSANRRVVREVRAAERRARAAERLAELGSMTGGLAHEIKNPLSTIGLNAQLLAEGVDELEVDAEHKGRLLRRIGSLRREVERLRGILTDFLEYAGELRLDPKASDLNTVVEELADFYMPQAEKQGIRLRTDLTLGPLPAWIDVQAVKQAVLNLMLNAVQAMALTTTTTTTTTTAPIDQAQLSTPATPRELILRTNSGQDAERHLTSVLHVIDTGPGISAETLAKVFQPYFTTKSGGTGLGLPASRRIIEAHHGRIDIHTEPGRGTDFTITLPQSAPPPPSQPARHWSKKLKNRGEHGVKSPSA